MSFLPVYLDASAIMKLVVAEPETGALTSALGQWPDRVSSALARVEVHHLAAALSLGDDPDAFITYDARLARAAKSEELRVLHPGVERLT